MNKRILTMAVVSGLLLSGCNSTVQQLSNTLLQGNSGSNTTSATTSSVASGGTVTALLGGLLEGVLGGSTLTEKNILGTWKYNGASVVFESSNALQRVGGSAASAAIEQKVDAQLTKLGFNSNTCQFTFNNDKTFKGIIAGRSFSGDYVLNTSEKTLRLNYLGGVMHTTMNVALNGGELSLLFEADKLQNILTTLGGMSGNSTINTLSNLLASYDGMLVGLELKK
ncbi:MAG: DUF4923 family protein [Bacteroidaceae bacterium]|nr:DUF4923 family protein [Bacteroidaceae bacterium]